ncbi:MAG: TIGR03960 family B12-binding radical SAM protein [Deltaproteobacteria bacterium]|nr:TIGR03960 family B12-binding radical SAM protein [Deltaproteobacteria bacterium]
MLHPYRDFIHRVHKPSRYLGGEYGAIVKRWEQVQCRICLAFPDTYEVGMSHLGFKILYALINDQPELLAERSYAPWIDMERELRTRAEPLRSLESFHPLSDFDIVGFSLQFELTFTNILQMLDLGGIPLRGRLRTDSDPLILAGGPNATHPEPVAPFIDAFLVGDGEPAVIELMRLWSRLKRAGASRAERLKQLARLPGIYVPEFYQTAIDPETKVTYVAQSLCADAAFPVKRVVLDEIDRFDFPVEGPVANTETIFDRVSVEIARGCTEGCRFCQAGMIYRPLRERDPRAIIETVKNTVCRYGYEAASLTSLSTTDYSAISPLLQKLAREIDSRRVSLVVSSLRAYGLDEEVLDDLKRGRASGLTFAPEAGSQRLRDVINKNVTDEQLTQTVERVFSRGWSKIKLYFMIGLPTERDEDVLAIIETGARAQRTARSIRGKRAQVVVSVSTHVPKPHTPFQWCAMGDIDEIRRKHRLLQQAARRHQLTLRLHDSEASWLEAILARGDRTLAEVIALAYEKGARFDSWSDAFQFETWLDAFDQTGVDANRFLKELPISSHLPWEHIHTGVERRFLEKEYYKALEGRSTPPCGKPLAGSIRASIQEENRVDYRESDRAQRSDQRVEHAYVCHRCGIGCDLERMRERREAHLRAFVDSPRNVATRAYARQDGPFDRTDSTREIERDVTASSGEHRLQKRTVPARLQETARIRLGYRKLGRAAFASHLDMIRLLSRICRRADLPLCYSQGFHPKALMTFGPALSLGVYSLSEYVDIRVESTLGMRVETLAERLTRVAPCELPFFGARKLEAEDAKLNRVIDRALYVVGICPDALKSIGLLDLKSLADRIEERRRANLTIERESERRRNSFELSRTVADARLSQGDEILQRAGLESGLIALKLLLRITESGTPNVRLVLNALLDSRDIRAHYVRAALLWTRDEITGTPLDLELLRSNRG